VLAILLAPRGLAAINDGPDGHRKVLALFEGPCRGLTIDPTS
jgi:hypothetical protein